MIVSEHLSGVAIAYDALGGNTKKGVLPSIGRLQGSLIGYQKRQIADACEYMRLRCKRENFCKNIKPRIFVCTTSDKWETDKPNIKAFTHNLKNGYGCLDYVWVKELNQNASPHFHFVALMPYIQNPVKLSLYWSSLFDQEAKNSVRLGTAPVPGVRRKYYLENSKMAYYLAKYLGKEMGLQNSWKLARQGRTFGISHDLAAISQPVRYEVNYHYREETKEVLTVSGMQTIKLCYPTGTTLENDIGGYFNKSKYKWTKSKDHHVYFGRLK
jgi:hypothetical protein